MWDETDLIGVLVSVVLIGLVIVGGVLLQGYSCANTSELMKMNSTYRITSGCMVEYEPGKWININNLRVDK